MPSTSSTPTARSATPRPTSRAPTGASQRAAAAAARAGHHPGRARLHRRHARRRARDAGPRRLRPHRHPARRARSAPTRVSLWKDVPGLLTADPAGGARRPRHPAAPRPRGGRARLLRGQGAASARADSGRRAGGSRSTSGRSPTPTRPAPRSPSGSAPARFPVKALTAAGGQALVTVTGNGMLGVPGIAARTFAALHAPADLGVAHLAGLVGAFDLLQRARGGRRATRARASSASSASEIAPRRDRRRRAQPRHGDGRGRGPRHARHAGRGGRRLLRARRRRGSTSSPSRRARSELNISVVVEARQAAEAQRRIHAAFQLSRIAGGAVIQPERMEVDPARLRPDRAHPRRRWSAGCAGRRSTLKVAGGHRPLGVRVRPRRDSGRGGSPRWPRREAAGPALGRAPRRHAPPPPRRRSPHIASYALTRPVLVDLTADDTAARAGAGARRTAWTWCWPTSGRSPAGAPSARRSGRPPARAAAASCTRPPSAPGCRSSTPTTS